MKGVSPRDKKRVYDKGSRETSVAGMPVCRE